MCEIENVQTHAQKMSQLDLLTVFKSTGFTFASMPVLFARFAQGSQMRNTNMRARTQWPKGGTYHLEATRNGQEFPRKPGDLQGDRKMMEGRSCNPSGNT